MPPDSQATFNIGQESMQPISEKQTNSPSVVLRVIIGYQHLQIRGVITCRVPLSACRKRASNNKLNMTRAGNLSLGLLSSLSQCEVVKRIMITNYGSTSIPPTPARALLLEQKTLEWTSIVLMSTSFQGASEPTEKRPLRTPSPHTTKPTITYKGYEGRQHSIQILSPCFFL